MSKSEMRFQSSKSNMRDNRRRNDKRTDGIRREESRRKQCKKKQRRQGLRGLVADDPCLDEDKVDRAVVLKSKEETSQESALKLENKNLRADLDNMAKRLALLEWNLAIAAAKGAAPVHPIHFKVHKAQARYIRKLETSNKRIRLTYPDNESKYSPKYSPKYGPSLDTIWELSGIAC